MCHHQAEDQGSQEEEEATPRPGRDHHEALPQDRAQQDPEAQEVPRWSSYITTFSAAVISRPDHM